MANKRFSGQIIYGFHDYCSNSISTWHCGPMWVEKLKKLGRGIFGNISFKLYGIF
jgi:hypothetical protein